MKELVSDTGLEFAIEKTRQHFWQVHSDIRLEFNRVQDETLLISAMLYQQAAGPVSELEPVKPPPPSKEIKEIYRRVCNLCHPDKVGHDDILLEFMRDAKSFYKESSDGIFTLYANLKQYLENPKLYLKVKQKATEEHVIKKSPWYSVYTSYYSGDLRTAFIQSRRLFGISLAEAKNNLEKLKLTAKGKGITK